ncbi:MAG: response regulator [Acidobacteriota bacterium]|nr:response regulator [Acidobacteriota bacterium]
MSSDAMTDANTSTGSILVVDDEPSMREMLSIMLRAEGYEVLVADGGRSAVEILCRRPIDLLISDIKMPEMNGIEVLRQAKEIREGIVGILMTAYKSTESLQSALRLGAVDYLDKPFNNDVLKKKVREALEQRRLRSVTRLWDRRPTRP